MIPALFPVGADMTKKRLWLTILLIISCAAALFFVNRDIREYKFIFPYARTYTMDSSPKGFYGIGDLLTLKPGKYEIRYYGETDGKQNAYCVQDANGNILAEDFFPQGPFEVSADLTVSGKAIQIRPGIFYEADGSALTVRKIMVYCPNVLYRDTLISHGITSLFVILVFLILILRLGFPEFWKRRVPAVFQGENELIFLLMILLTALSCIPMWVPDSYVIGDDFLFHLGRIQGIADSLRAGYFPARIHLFTLSDYGHGSGFFYPQVWIYIPALLRLCGYSILTAYDIFVTLCTFASVCAMYYCTRRISCSKAAAVIAAILYAFASYRLINIYYRAALGEVQSFIFAPLIVSAAYDLTHGHSEKWPVLALGFFGLLGSHLITLGIFGIIFLVILAAGAKKLFTDKSVIPAILKAAACVILPYAYFILPLIEQWTTTELAINSYLSLQSEIDAHPPYIWTDLFAPFQTWKFYNRRRHPFPGIPLLISAVLPFFTFRNKDEGTRFARFLACVSLFSLWMSTNLFPWDHCRWLLSRLQFSWRLLAIPTVLLPVCGGTALVVLLPKVSKKLLILITFVVCAGFTVPFMSHVLGERMRYYENFILEDDRLGTGEYLPVYMAKAAFRDFTAQNQNTVHYQGEPITVQNPKRSGLSFSFDYDLPEISGDGVFEIPLTYYTGYKGSFRADGITDALEVRSSNRGLTSVSGITESHGSIRVWYEKTKIQKTGEWISLLSLAVITAAAVSSGRKKKTALQDGADHHAD